MKSEASASAFEARPQYLPNINLSYILLPLKWQEWCSEGKIFPYHHPISESVTDARHLVCGCATHLHGAYEELTESRVYSITVKT